MQNLNIAMINFRLASRELFNHYFRLPEPYPPQHLAWQLMERFERVEELLFEKMIVEPFELPTGSSYASALPQIRVVLKNASTFVPAMINRELSSGYWDDPKREISQNAQLSFVRYFDFDWLSYRDNSYVQCEIARWDDHVNLERKLALVEVQYVSFELRISESG